jgi:hypothetical protein
MHLPKLSITASELGAYCEAIIQRAVDSPALFGRVEQMRNCFADRAGHFSPSDAWFERRMLAFWDDALTTQQLAVASAPMLSHERFFSDGAAIATCLSRAHRGLFRVAAFARSSAHLIDTWSGAEFFVDPRVDESQSIALAHAQGLFDGRVVAVGDAIMLLPGAFFHPIEATDAIGKVLEAAIINLCTTQQVLDALLRMELAFLSSSRVKATFAYRPALLSDPAATRPR